MHCRPLVLTAAIALAITTALAQTAPTKKAPAKEKKVWTNDDLEEIHNQPGISVVGSEQAGTSTKAEKKEKGDAEKKAPYDKTKDPKWYQERLAPLRAQVDQIDRQIQQIQSSLASPGSTGGIVLGKGMGISPQNRIDLLNQQRSKIQQQIDAIEEEARRNSIEPGALR